MKKRITALLLCLVMALSLIPTTVWAAPGADRVPLTLNVSSYGAPFINGNTGDHTVNSYPAMKYIDKSAVGSDNSSGSATARFVGSNETGWTLVIDVVVVNYKETWTTNARVTNKDMSAATGSVTFGLSFNTSGGTSTYIHISGAKDLPIPDPVASELGNPVTVDDTTNVHGDFNYPIADADMKTITGTGATRTVTINSNNYVPRFNDFYKVEHTLTNAAQQTITLTYSNGKWSASNTVTFTVVCEEEKPADPTKPSDDEVKNLLTQNITVVDDTDLHAKKNYKLKSVDGSFTVGEVTTKDGKFVCPVTIKFQPFVDKYSKDVKKDHSLTNASETETVVELVASYDKESNTWTWAAASKAAITIHVKCEIPAAPTDAEIAKAGKVRVICNTNDKHETKVYDLIPGTYTTTGISELTGKPVKSEVIYDEDYEQFVFDIYILNKDEYGADSVDGIAPYVDKYNKEFGAHAVVDTFTMCTLAYNEESGAWELLKGMVLDPDTDEAVLDEYYGAARISVQCVNDPTAEDLKELGVTVDVDCKKTKHTAKDYDLTGDETLTVTKKEENGVWTATVSLSKDSAKAFLKQYSKDIGKSHTKLVTNGTIDLVFEDGVWTLADAEKNVLNITTNCSTSGGGTTTTPDDGGKKVESGKTFDAGIAMYVGLSILSVTGGALVIGKKKEF